MKIKELARKLGHKNINELGARAGYADGTLQVFATRNKSEEAQDRKCTEILIRYYNISAEELLDMISPAVHQRGERSGGRAVEI